MILKYLVAWLVMPLIGIGNAVIRELTYKQYVGGLLAHQISTVTGIIFLGIYIWFVTLYWRIQSACQAVATGLMWLVLTVSFEFLFGHYVMKNPWSKLLYDYNILEGRIWILVLIWITIAPRIFYKFHPSQIGKSHTERARNEEHFPTSSARVRRHVVSSSLQ